MKLDASSSGYPRYRHGGSWRGAKTAIQYVPALGVFSFILANNSAERELTSTAKDLLELHLKSLNEQ